MVAAIRCILKERMAKVQGLLQEVLLKEEEEKGAASERGEDEERPQAVQL